MAKKADKGLENRELVLDILTEVLEQDGFVHLVLNQALSKYQYLEKADRAFITRITEGTLDYLIQIDWVINQYSKTKTDKMKPLIRNLLRMSVYQLLYMDRVPDSAVCNEAVKLAIKRRFAGLKGFVNGVLRTISREKASLVFGTPCLKYSIPQWMYNMWEKDFGVEKAERIAASFLEDSPTWARCIKSRASREQILASLKKQGARARSLPWMESMISIQGYDYLEALECFKKGWIQIQDVSSALVGEAASPKEGDYIIDVCAAPGGKSLHLAELLNGTGLVEARDVSLQKTALIEENVARCGVSNVRTLVWDALEPDHEAMGRADIVIADLPCSGLGVMGKKPDIKYHMTPQKARELAAFQRDILSVVWQYVKPGGILVYSTCTVNKNENEENARFLAEQLPMEPVDLSERLPGFGGEPSLKQGYIQFLPGVHPFDGFFVSVFRRSQ